MIHVRVVAPGPLVERVLSHLLEQSSVVNVVHLPNAARKPDGDLIMCDVAREEASVVLGTLKRIGCSTRGTIAAADIDLSMSEAAEEAERSAAGSPSDAVLWESVTAHTSESAELSVSFLLFMVLATMIGAIGILTDSVILIIGAMVVGPEFGPLAGVCVALLQRRAGLALRSAAAVGGGFAAGIGAVFCMIKLLLALGLAPASLAAHPHTLFISRPDFYAGLIAGIAGIAGMLSLTTSKPGALIGVFISVTTVPAAANIGVATAYGNMVEARGAALQLALNLLTIVMTGYVTLLVQRLAFVRRWRSSLRRRRRQVPDGSAEA